MGKRSGSRQRDSWWMESTGGAQHWVVVLTLAVGFVFLGGSMLIASQRTDAVPYQSRPVQAPDYATPTPDRTRVAFLGDSWAGGAGSDNAGAENSYAGKAARELGWAYSIFPGGGTGYTTGNDATGEGPFSSRVQSVIDAEPDVVVVQGSSNDYRADEEEIEAAASSVFATLRAALPDARIYAVGVINSPDAPDDANDVSRSAVAAAASANGVQFIDANADGWLNEDTDFADGYHPNEQGHQKVADRLAAALRAD